MARAIKTAAITIERIFDAGRREVWRAWSDAQWLKQWWGPKDFTAPTIKLDFHLGGKYLFCMRSPEKKDYWSTGKYTAIVIPKLISCTDSFADEHGSAVGASYYGMSEDFPLETQITAAFEEIEDKTRLILRHEGIPAGQILQECTLGWNQSLDKLQLLLKHEHFEILVKS